MSQLARSRSGARATQQRAVETRASLVDAALEVFASYGFEGATTREIARRAGVALAALPYHFTTKEALWKAAADRIFGLLQEHFEAHRRDMERADPQSRLRVLLREFVVFAAKYPELHRFMLQEGTDRSERLVWLVDTHVRPLYRLVVGLVEVGQANGVLDEGRGEQFFYALIGAASLPYAVAPEYQLLTRAKPDSPRRVEDHVGFLLRLFKLDA
jgi:TetR/AcrR family transcriptional regulator